MKIPRVREMRENQGLTQEQLADRAEVSAGTIRRIERGHEANPPTALKIATALGCQPADLRGQKEVPA